MPLKGWLWAAWGPAQRVTLSSVFFGFWASFGDRHPAPLAVEGSSPADAFRAFPRGLVASAPVAAAGFRPDTPGRASGCPCELRRQSPKGALGQVSQVNHPFHLDWELQVSGSQGTGTAGPGRGEGWRERASPLLPANTCRLRALLGRRRSVRPGHSSYLWTRHWGALWTVYSGVAFLSCPAAP